MALSPLLENLPAHAGRTPKPPKPPAIIHPWQTSQAPVILIFNHVGCERERIEYKGAMSNTADDERCIKLAMKPIVWVDEQVRSFQAERQAVYGAKYQDLVMSGYNGKYTPGKVGEGYIHPADSDYCKAGGSDCPQTSGLPASGTYTKK